MKLFFASDLHGSLDRTTEILEKYRRSGAEYLILLGDLLNHGPRNPVPDSYKPAQVAELLNRYADHIIAVRGNCDSEVDQMLLEFPMMESYSWLLMENGQRMFLTHGHEFNASNRPRLKAGDVIAHGHTHIPLAEKDGDQYIFNPGSVTFPKGGFAPSYGTYEDGLLRVITLSGEMIKETRL